MRNWNQQIILFFRLRNPAGYPEVCGILEHENKGIFSGHLGYGKVSSKKNKDSQFSSEVVDIFGYPTLYIKSSERIDHFLG